MVLEQVGPFLCAHMWPLLLLSALSDATRPTIATRASGATSRRSTTRCPFPRRQTGPSSTPLVATSRSITRASSTSERRAIGGDDQADALSLRFELEKYIHLSHEVVGAEWIEQDSKWRVAIKGPDGVVFQKECDVLINAGGEHSENTLTFAHTDYGSVKVSSTRGSGRR